MDVLRISLFGGVRVACNGGPSEAKVTPTVQALLAYLLLYRHRAHPREVLVDLLWGDHSEGRARGCLNTTLWRLRSVLEPDGVPRGTYLVTTPTNDVAFNCASPHWLDVEVFEEKTGRVLSHPADGVDAAIVAELERALELYRAELLEGFYYTWALRERERLRMLHLNSLAYLMRYYRHQGAYEKSIAWGQQILQHDPLREEIHREMMRLYVANRQRAMAVRQYELCCEVLDAELGIPPMEETQRLYTQTVAGTWDTQVTASPARLVSDYPNTLQQLQLAVQGLDEAQTQLRRAMQLLERLIGDQAPRKRTAE